MIHSSREQTQYYPMGKKRYTCGRHNIGGAQSIFLVIVIFVALCVVRILPKGYYSHASVIDIFTFRRSEINDACNKTIKMACDFIDL